MSEIYDEEYSVSYYSPGPMTANDVSGWLGMVAAILNVIESMFYIIGWHVDRDTGDPKIVLEAWFKDWNFWGNWFFLFGSLGYIFTSYSFLESVYYSECIIVSITMGALFICDRFHNVFFLSIISLSLSAYI